MGHFIQPGLGTIERPFFTEVFCVKFCMRHYASASMKPTMVLTNSHIFAALNLGSVSKQKRRGAKQTTRRYIDSKGRKRYCGTRSLKASQSLTFN